MSLLCSHLILAIATISAVNSESTHGKDVTYSLKAGVVQEHLLHAKVTARFHITNVPTAAVSLTAEVHCQGCVLALHAAGSTTTGHDLSHSFTDNVHASNLSFSLVLHSYRNQSANQSESPALVQLFVTSYGADSIVPGGCGGRLSPQISMFTADGSLHVDILPAAIPAGPSLNCRKPNAAVTYQLVVVPVAGSSYSQLYEAMTVARWPFNTPLLPRISGPTWLENGTLRFVVLAERHAVTVYSVAVEYASGRTVHGQAYVPVSYIPCALDSLGMRNVSCDGLLHRINTSRTVDLASKTPVTLTYSQPLHSATAVGANASDYIMLQAHSQRTALSASLQTDPQSSKLNPVSVARSLDIGLGMYLTNLSSILTSQYAVQLEQSVIKHAEVHVSVITGSTAGPVPGGCSPLRADRSNTFNPQITLRALDGQRTTRISFKQAHPQGATIPGSCQRMASDLLTYHVYRKMLTGNDLQSADLYKSVMEQMSTVDGIHTALDVELERSLSEFHTGVLDFPSCTDCAEFYGVVVEDNVTGTSAAYMPTSVYHCLANVDPILPYGSPCKVILSTMKQLVRVQLVDFQVMSFLINATVGPADITDGGAGFVVVQTHSQLHRVRASPQLKPLLKQNTEGQDVSAGVLVSRSTGLVMSLSPGTNLIDYYAAMYSFVESNVQVRTIFYPPTAPIPGGCCASPPCTANALLNITLNESMIAVSFHDAAVTVAGKRVCAHNAGSMHHVHYVLYGLSLNSSNETVLFDGLLAMYTVSDIQQNGQRLATFAADSDEYNHQFPAEPGQGRIYAVIVTTEDKTSPSADAVSSAYVPTTSYDCQYVSSSSENAGQPCKIVLEPNQTYMAQVNSTSNLSFVLNDWQPSAAQWSFVIMSAHSQRRAIQASPTATPSLTSSYSDTDAAISKLLSVHGANEQALLYINYMPNKQQQQQQQQADITSAGAEDNVNVMVVATPYTTNVPIPGACCLTCTLDIDANLNVTYSRYSTTIQFHPANVGYVDKQLPPCYGSRSPLHTRLRYYVYKSPLGFAKFGESKMFEGIKKMSTLEGVVKHGVKVTLPPTAYIAIRTAILNSRRGEGMVYNILVEDPQTGNRAVYSPSVSYGCDLNGRVLGCDAIGSMFAKIMLTITGLVGLVFVFFGHFFYVIELFACTLSVVLLLVFPLVSIYTTLSFAARISIAIVCGSVCGALMLLQWRRSVNYHTFTIALGLPPGFLIAGLLFFTPFGNLAAFHQPVSYWLAFVAVSLWVPVAHLYFPVKGNLVTTSWLGGYAIILAVNQYADTELVFIIMDVILHAVKPTEFTRKDYHDYSMMTLDVLLSVMWALLTVAGVVFQYYWLKRRNLLSTPVSETAYAAYLREQERLENDQGGADGPHDLRAIQESEPLLKRRIRNRNTCYNFLSSVFKRFPDVRPAAARELHSRIDSRSAFRDAEPTEPLLVND